jgi:hypothetical protein
MGKGKEDVKKINTVGLFMRKIEASEDSLRYNPKEITLK